MVHPPLTFHAPSLPQVVSWALSPSLSTTTTTTSSSWEALYYAVERAYLRVPELQSQVCV